MPPMADKGHKMRQTYMTREDYDVSVGFFDSIAWLFEGHINEADTKEFNFAVLYGNEDCPEKIELWRCEPKFRDIPDKVWTPKESE
jgi:hypothetical protein